MTNVLGFPSPINRRLARILPLFIAKHNQTRPKLMNMRPAFNHAQSEREIAESATGAGVADYPRSEHDEMRFDRPLADPTTPGDRIARLRAKAGLTQSQLAERAGIKKGTIGAYELGSNKLHANWLKHQVAVESIAKVVGVPPHVIWTGEGMPEDDAMETTVVGKLTKATILGSLPVSADVFELTLSGGAEAWEPLGDYYADFGDSFEREELERIATIVATDSQHAPRIARHDRLFVLAASKPEDGVFSVVEIDGQAEVWGMRRIGRAWFLVSPSAGLEPIPFDGKVLARVVGVEYRMPDGGYVREVSRHGIAVAPLPRS